MVGGTCCRFVGGGKLAAAGGGAEGVGSYGGGRTSPVGNTCANVGSVPVSSDWSLCSLLASTVAATTAVGVACSLESVDVDMPRGVVC